MTFPSNSHLFIMEDNKQNELIENGTINSFLRSGSNRIVTQTQHVKFVNLASKSKLKERNVKEKQFFELHAHTIKESTSAKTENAETLCSSFESEDEFSQLKGNGVSTTNIEQIVVSGRIANKRSKHAEVSQYSDDRKSRQSSSRKSVFLFYKAAGDWWNVFPKTDYTYSKSSSCREEIAPGIMPIPNLSRSPIRSSNGRKGLEISSLRLNNSFSRSQSEYYSDDVCNVSSTTQTTTSTRRSLLLWMITIVSHIFSSIFEVLTLKKYRLGFESTSTPQKGGHIRERTSRYHRLEVFCYRSACYFLLLDTWLLSLFHNSRDKGFQLTDKRKHSKYLLLLLIPPLLLLGSWYNSMGTSAVAVLSSSMSGMKKLLPSISEQETSTSDFAKFPNFFLEDGNMDHLVQKILSSAEFKNILLMQDFRNKEHQMGTESVFFSAIELEQERLKAELDHENLLLVEQKKILMDQQISNEKLILENSAMKDQIEQLERKMKTLQAQRLYISRKIEDCRKIIIQTVPKIDIEHHVTNFLSGIFGNSNEMNRNGPENIKIWLKSLEAAKDNLEERLADTVTILNGRIQEATDKTAETIMTSVSEIMKQEFLKQELKGSFVGIKSTLITREKNSGDPCCECSLAIDQVKEIVNKAIHHYDADKTGMVDYALESGGGTVINIRCTENYNEKPLVLSFFGMKFPWFSNHPRIALQPDVHPGNCWAFRGAQGYLVIRLSNRIKVSAFSIEHIPVSISPTGNINAAPKNFSVFGLNDENDPDPVLLGKYIYMSSGTPLQIFPVQNESAPPFEIIELIIQSNHGNLEYTCLYRFRVHGVAV